MEYVMGSSFLKYGNTLRTLLLNFFMQNPIYRFLQCTGEIISRANCRHPARKSLSSGAIIISALPGRDNMGPLDLDPSGSKGRYQNQDTGEQAYQILFIRVIAVLHAF